MRADPASSSTRSTSTRQPAAEDPRRRSRRRSQGLITIPEVNRMLLETSVIEGDMHRLRPVSPPRPRGGFPDLRLTGQVVRVGALAQRPGYRPPEDKRFDLTVELDPTSADLRPEMTVRADIVVGRRRDVLLCRSMPSSSSRETTSLT